MNSYKAIKLALGSGGYFGFAHIGVLKVLEREGIKVEAISGSSVGSIMAVLHAKGLSADEMEKASLEFAETLFTYRSWTSVISNHMSEEKMMKAVEDLIWVKDFSQLKIPTFICATDLVRFKTVWFSEGIWLQQYVLALLFLVFSVAYLSLYLWMCLRVAMCLWWL